MGHGPAASTGRRARPARWRGARRRAACRPRAGTTAAPGSRRAAASPDRRRAALASAASRSRTGASGRPSRSAVAMAVASSRPGAPTRRGSSPRASPSARPRCSCSSTAANPAANDRRRASGQLDDRLGRRPAGVDTEHEELDGVGHGVPDLRAADVPRRTCRRRATPARTTAPTISAPIGPTTTMPTALASRSGGDGDPARPGGRRRWLAPRLWMAHRRPAGGQGDDEDGGECQRRRRRRRSRRPGPTTRPP